MSRKGADQGAERPEKARPKPTREEAPGKLVDRKYVIVRVLGRGGMGIVYLARDVHTGTDVVLKAIRSELAHRLDIRERTVAEGRVLAQIDHPNVVQLKAVVMEEDGSIWLVMQYVEGESLDETIKRHREQGKHVPLTEAVDLFRQVVRGVASAHAEGIIHRDLKPANVLVRGKDGVAKVTDFGIAKPEEQARAGEGNTKGVIGSLYYMSPEQVKGQRDLDKRVDIYALGILFYELLVGTVPFSAKSNYELMRMHVDEPLPRAGDKRPGLPAWVEDVLDKACAKDRADRYATCEELLAALDQADKPLPVTETAPAVEAPPASARAAWLWLTLAAVIVLGLLAAGLWVVILHPKGPRIASERRPPAAPTEPPRPTPQPSARASASAALADKPTPPLLRLVGPWRSESGRDFEGVLVGDVIEFRVRDPKQLAPQDYRAGEARFALRPVEAQRDVFAVEDKIRPLPPDGSVYDSARSRTTCQEVWTEAGGRPLRARFDGTRLSVEYAKIEPKTENFVQEQRRVVACRGLASVPATIGTTILTRP